MSHRGSQSADGVGRAGSGGGFTLSFEAGFAERLTEDELTAAVAHELGHVWIYTYFPFLQTEQLANEIAMRVVSRESLGPCTPRCSSAHA